MINEQDQAVLRDLTRIARVAEISFFVIGAGARFLVYDWPAGLSGGRGTTDWDIAVRVSSWEEFLRVRDALTANQAGFKTTAAEHRFEHSSGRKLEVVPYGGVEDPDRTVTYPKGETTHSVLGLSECESCCVEVDIGDGLRVQVVEPPGLVLLKAKAYLDRRSETTRDVQDVNFMVSRYQESLDDATVLERAGEVLQDENVLYEDVGAYLLALDVRELAVAEEALEPLVALVAELTDVQGKAVDHLLEKMGDEPQQRAAIVRRYRAFALGMSVA